MKTIRSLLATMFMLCAITGCRPSKSQQNGGQKPAIIPEIPKSFQVAFEGEPPYGLDFEQGFAAGGQTLAYEDTPAGVEADMITGYFVKAKPGKASLLYLRHEDLTGGTGTHVFSLQLPKLAVGPDSISRERFKGVLYIFYNTPEADFFQARRGEGTVLLEAVTRDSAKGTLALSLVGKRAQGKVKESQPKEMNVKLSGRFALPLLSPKEVAALQKAREAATPNPFEQGLP